MQKHHWALKIHQFILTGQACGLVLPAMQFPISILIALALAGAAPFLVRFLGDRAKWVMAAGPFACLLIFANELGQYAETGAKTVSWAWVPSLNVDLGFYLDGLGLLFALLISGVGTMVFLYAGGYLKGSAKLGRFYGWIALFFSAMLGLVLSDNILVMFIFWELTSISSYMLIGHYHENERNRQCARQALVITVSGGLVLMAGLIVLGLAAGSWSFSGILAGGSLAEHAHYPLILTLVAIGAFTKSAQFPFHFWLPNAMAGPAPVSALLHSATMVKAGVFLLARLNPTLGSTDAWFYLLTSVGSLTMVWNALLALRQDDLKKILAYSTTSVLGALVMLIGIGDPAAIQAAMVLLLAHGLYKGALFMTAGAVDHESGERNVDRLGGLRGLMPFTFAAAAIAAFSNAGFPPMLGFVAKEYLYKAKTAHPDFLLPLLVLTLVANMCLFAVAWIVGFRPFIGKKKETPKPAHEAPWSMRIGPIVLALTGLVFGLNPSLIDQSLIAPAKSAVMGSTFEVDLKLYSGINLPLILSFVTVIGGIIMIRLYPKWRALKLPLVAAEDVFERLLAGILSIADRLTRLTQNGQINRYILTIIAAVSVFFALTLLRSGSELGLSRIGEAHVHEWILVIAICASAIMTTQARSPIIALLSAGGAGLGIALVFAFYSAPDLALTQLLIETLTVILFALAFHRLPAFRSHTSKLRRSRDAIVATVFGVLMATLTLIAAHTQAPTHVADFFREASLPDGKGRNVVNVILVDFRALDTFGEIVVLGIGVLAIITMLRAGKRTKDHEA
ncbi:MAG: multicomponent Na+:H+ antiporter subunit A [Candidatus Azotimanducaceae bacterium]|jgi:multicomponent Na+:H+ antiporter subunit A